MNVGESISKFRKETDLTQKQLAELLCVSPDLVSKWENGNRRPDYTNILKMCEIFDVKPEVLINSESAIVDELKTAIPEIVERDNLLSCLNSFLGKLKEKERTVFMLRYSFFLDTKTIADKIGTSDGYIRNMLARTRKKLKSFLGGQKHE